MILVLVAFVTLVSASAPCSLPGWAASEDLFDIVRDRLVQILGRLSHLGEALFTAIGLQIFGQFIIFLIDLFTLM